MRHGAFPSDDGPTDAVAADFDEDGDADVAVGNITELGGGVSVLFNDGQGGLGNRRLESLGGVVVGPGEVKLADFDRDGHVDITAVADDTEVEVLFGDGTGRFEQHGFRAGEAPRSVTPLDLNDDGPARPGGGEPTENAIFVLHNDGSRGFGSPIKFPVATPRLMSAADLDGRPDLPQPGQRPVRGYRASPSAWPIPSTSTPATWTATVTSTSPSCLGGDEPDAGTDDFVSVLINDGTGHLTTRPTFTAGTDPRGVAVVTSTATGGSTSR